MKVAIIGTVGVPANYGGFETLVENIIGENCSKDVTYTIYCSSKTYADKVHEYKNAKLKYIPLKANGMQSIPYDIISMINAIRNSDVMLILGVSGCCFLPIIRLLFKGRIIVNIDGLEHKRDKWSHSIRKFLKFSEKKAVNYADVIVSDNKAIQDYVMSEYGKPSELIAYGGDHVQCDVSDINSQTLLKYGLKEHKYSFSLCRIEPENNVHITLEAFERTGEKLVFVGNWLNSAYGKELLVKYGHCSNIKMESPIYDIKVLNVLRSNCVFYLHGHSAGGTNPSLVEAMFFAKPILSFDCSYNRETTENKANYFLDANELVYLLSQPMMLFATNASSMVEIAKRRYCWSIIAAQYENIYKKNTVL